MSYYEYDDDIYSSSYYEAVMKNDNLVHIGDKMKNDMCHIGQKKVKLLLNSLVKKGDRIAGMYRQILECENCNINAKKYYNTVRHNYKEHYYNMKKDAIDNLIKDIIDYNSTVSESDMIVFGKQSSDVYDTNDIVYFELPGLEQISFHTDISQSVYDMVPEYKKEWDEKVNSTLSKIESGINHRYGDELQKKYGKEIEAYFERMQKREDEYKRKQEEYDFKISHIIDVINAGECADMYSIACSIEYGYLFNRAFGQCTNEKNKIDYVLYLWGKQIQHHRLMPLYNSIQTTDDISAVYKALVMLFISIQSFPTTFSDLYFKSNSKYITDVFDAICRYNVGAIKLDGEIKLIKNKNNIIFGNVPRYGNIVLCDCYNDLTQQQQQCFAHLGKTVLKQEFKFRKDLQNIINMMVNDWKNGKL